MIIAITAASGQLGRSIANEAIAKLGRDNVIGIARTPSKASDLGIDIRKGDYDNPADFVSAFQGVDVALILSGMDAPDKRIVQHRNVIAGAKEAGVRKVIYTSIYGIPGRCSFDAIINSNRQTEKDVESSGMEWSIGRNGLYIDADIEAIADYRKHGKIANSAGEGKCAYTSRSELAAAYANLIVDDALNGRAYNLCGASATQEELTQVLNEVFGEKLTYEPMNVEDYVLDRKNAHGEFFGGVIAGIYQGIRNGVFDVPSDFQRAAGRPHRSLLQMVKGFK